MNRCIIVETTYIRTWYIYISNPHVTCQSFLESTFSMETPMCLTRSDAKGNLAAWQSRSLSLPDTSPVEICNVIAPKKSMAKPKYIENHLKYNIFIQTDHRIPVWLQKKHHQTDHRKHPAFPCLEVVSWSSGACLWSTLRSWEGQWRSWQTAAEGPL